MCSIIASIRRIRWAAWFSISAVTATPSGSSSPITTCTALQLANFWQDVSRDLEKGRIYIPLDALAAHGLTESDIVERRFSERYVSLMKDLIARTRALFALGLPLAQKVEARIARGHRNVQPRRSCRSRRHRIVWIRHAESPPGDLKVEAGSPAGRGTRLETFEIRPER